MTRSSMPPLGGERPAFPTLIAGLAVVGALHRLPRADDSVQRATVVCERPTPSAFRFAVFTLVWVDTRWVVERRRLDLSYHGALAELIRDRFPAVRLSGREARRSEDVHAALRERHRHEDTTGGDA